MWNGVAGIVMFGWNVEPNGISSKFHSELEWNVKNALDDCFSFLSPFFFGLVVGLISKYAIKSHIPRPNKWHWNIYTLFTCMPFTFRCERKYTHIFTVWVFLISKLVGSVKLLGSFGTDCGGNEKFSIWWNPIKEAGIYFQLLPGDKIQWKKEQKCHTCQMISIYFCIIVSSQLFSYLFHEPNYGYESNVQILLKLFRVH